MLVSGSPTGEDWRPELAQDHGRLCQRRGTPGDCLTLFDDGPSLEADDKRRIALALAVGPALEGLDAEVRAMLSPTRLLDTLSLSITGSTGGRVVREWLRTQSYEQEAPEAGTRCWTASSILEFSPTEGERVLAELARTHKNAIGVTASLTLEQWKEGTFSPP